MLLKNSFFKVRFQFGRNYLCGGALLDGKTVLTAAHCCFGYRYSSGSHNFKQNFQNFSLRVLENSEVNSNPISKWLSNLYQWSSFIQAKWRQYTRASNLRWIPQRLLLADIQIGGPVHLWVISIGNFQNISCRNVT